jgi:hypothetical protein
VVTSQYRLAAEAGHVPAPTELMRRHPDLSDAIRLFFLL